MAFEQEFSIEIPDEEADKLKCCADVAQYIISAPKQDSWSIVSHICLWLVDYTVYNLQQGGVFVYKIS